VPPHAVVNAYIKAAVFTYYVSIKIFTVASPNAAAMPTQYLSEKICINFDCIASY
jgi:hypothetical protein